MTQHTLLKSSSRAGRFKKKLVSEDKLIHEAPIIVARMAPLLKMLQENLLSQAEFTALSIICTLSIRFPGTWLGAKSSLPLENKMSFPLKNLNWEWEKNIQARLTGVNTLGELLSGFAFKSTPLAVNRALLSWSTNQYPLILFFTIPTPEEVLQQQKTGHRCVTVMLKEAQLKRYILGERDSLSFTMHDLIHADHFYHDNHSKEGQLGFYGLLAKSLDDGDFKHHLTNEKFAAEFDYLISDMNAYAIHLMKCFKSAMTHYHSEGEAIFENWSMKVSDQLTEQNALKLLNKDQYQPVEHDHVILGLLSRYKQI